MSYDVIGGNTSNLRNEIIAAMVQRSLIERGQLIPTVTDVTSLASQDGVGKLSFPRVGANFQVQNLSEDEEADVQILDFNLDTLELNHHAIVAWFVKKRAQKQSSVDLEAQAILNASAVHAADIDRKIIAALAAGASAANTISSTNFLQANILQAKANIQKATRSVVSHGNATLLITSDVEAKVLALPAFSRVDQYGSDNAVVNGELGRIHGFRVVVTDHEEMPANTAIAYKQEALVYGNQLSPEFEEVIVPRKAGKECSLDQLYGIKVLQSGKYIAKLATNTTESE